jgi:hypothetical protein
MTPRVKLQSIPNIEAKLEKLIDKQTKISVQDQIKKHKKAVLGDLNKFIET